MLEVIFGLAVGLIVYVYVGYPALLAGVAGLARAWRRAAAAADAPLPRVTLLIAAYDEAETIAQKLDNSLALDYPAERLQILVAADGSRDATPRIVAGYAARGVLLNHEPARRGKMAAINRAMPRATGEIVVFSDANNFYAADALRQLVRPFADPRVGAASGAKVIARGDGALGDSEGLYWRYESAIKRWETAVDSCVGVAGEVLAVRRRLFEPPPEAIINDDFYMALRLLRRGYRVVYVPAARSVERVSPSAATERARRARIVAGRYQALWLGARLLPWKRPWLVWQIVSHKYLRPLVPLAMIAALAANAALAWTPGLAARLALALQAAFYGTAVLGARRPLRGRVGRLMYLPAYLVQSNLAALVGLYRFVTRTQSARWQRVPRRAAAAAGEEPG
ncbi:MAG: glycosyltransferase family 2 protein [Anaerolineales bacterium]|nr:glycosyltransferase family 2 protein [Anaerolineales bacterium]